MIDTAKMVCCFCVDEICVNADCPCCADYCPVQQDDYVSICKYYKEANTHELQ